MSRQKVRQAVREKAAKVYRYFLRGLTAPEIAQAENLPIRSIYWLLQESGRILEGEIKRLTKDGTIAELIASHKERKRQLWMLHSQAKADKDKVSCLAQLREEDEYFIELVSMFGIFNELTDDLPELVSKRMGNGSLF